MNSQSVSSPSRLRGSTAGLPDAFPQKQVIHEHQWREGDLLIVNNLRIMYCALSGYGGHARLLYRCRHRIRRQ